MKEFVLKVIEMYPEYVNTKYNFERHLEMRSNSEMLQALTTLNKKLAFIESWFSVLTTDERYVVRLALNGQCNLPGIKFSATKWGVGILQASEMLRSLYEQAITKLVSYAMNQSDTMYSIFSDVAKVLE